MPEFSDFYFTSSTGKNRIRARMCTPDAAPKAVIQIVHGIAEHVERYDDFMIFLASNGYLVVANDHLGHGKSIAAPEEQGFFAEENGWDYVVADVDKVHDYMTVQNPDLPYVFFGHSMGSFVTRTYIIKHPDKYDAVIISGTGMQAPAMVFGGLTMAKLAVKMYGPRKLGVKLNDIAFGSYNKCFEPRRTDYDWISSLPESVDKYANDPLCGFIPTVGLFRDMMTGVQFIGDKKNIALMNKDHPVYFMSGDKDPVGENGAGVERAYKAFCDAGIKDVYLKLYKDGRHEMLNEVNKDQVYADILAWIRQKVC